MTSCHGKDTTPAYGDAAEQHPSSDSSALGGTMRARTTAVATSAALVLVLTGCGGATTTPEQPATTSAAASPNADPAAKVRAWADAGGTDTLGTLAKSLGKVDKDSHPVDLAALQTSCAQLTADVEAAQGEDPMPAEKLAKRWK